MQKETDFLLEHKNADVIVSLLQYPAQGCEY